MGISLCVFSMQTAGFANPRCDFRADYAQGCPSFLLRNWISLMHQLVLHLSGVDKRWFLSIQRVTFSEVRPQSRKSFE
jgi:hypothetical protein